ncbi:MULTISPECIES: GAF domain-containing protein [unclassified Arthrobacter]|uniref:GAF domain-containing protein n=1 Tax=unclassified Arthrobacter TaxID=235627 RepID=UPI00149287AC|nr:MULTISPECIES: GAF domain-containing protein [unclassified Arthrobacter]MBE0009735.1 GAF domain-containing protein [Arthrobacter sp. AET 35A]NOJ63573.1 GAF domain-containing protein [Arthrobacter sp. 147(2020)]
MPESRLDLIPPPLQGPQRRLDTVAELARDFAGRFDLQPLLERILGHAVTLLGCGSGSISLVNESHGTYSKKVDFGVGCQEGQTFPLQEGVTGRVVRSRSTVILRRYSEVDGGHIAPDDPRWNCAVIGVPILWEERVIGTCTIFAADPDREFTDDDAGLAELFASQAAIALTNSQLHTRASVRAREAAIAAERERAVRDVHEAVGRSLAALLLSLDDAERAVRDDGSEPAVAVRHIGTARTIAHDALTETRRTVLGMGPASLAGRDLDTALAAELSWTESMSGAQTKLTVMGSPRPLTPEVDHQAFKIIQEALGNVVAHSRATAVRVGLVYEPAAIGVLVEDNGCGFDLAAASGQQQSLPAGCLGLHGMTSRAAHLGGELQIDTMPGWGTTIRATLPDQLPSRSGHPPARWKVLIGTDKPLVGAGLVRLLQLSEPAVQVAAEVGSAAQLEDAHQLLHPDILVVDLEMVQREAPDSLLNIRRSDPGAAIVVLTDHPTAAQIQLAREAGVRGFISQSADGETLARVIVAAGQGQALVDGELFDELLQSAAGRDAGPDTFTARERQVRTMVLKGMADKQIARELLISVKTVEKHVGSLLRKSGARNRTMLVSMNLTDQPGSGALVT